MGGGRFIASARNVKAMLEDADVLRMIRRRMGLGDTLGALPPECGGTGTTEGFDLGRVYPVGAIYMSASDADPGALFGGVWERIEGRFLLAADAFHAVGSMGGEETHMLTANEMPSHSHSVDHFRSPSAGSARNKAMVDGYGVHSTYTTGSAGGGKPHNNMPPYLAVYMWKRTA